MVAIFEFQEKLLRNYTSWNWKYFTGESLDSKEYLICQEKLLRSVRTLLPITKSEFIRIKQAERAGLKKEERGTRAK